MVSFWKRPIIEITRARRIAEVLVRNGLGQVVQYAGLNRFLPKRQTPEIQRAVAGLSMPQRVRKTLEELGPTYIKLGQI
ncbi:MAG: hypothetical protein ACYC6L_08695, partial [Anaerolineae bacterium]